MQDFGIDISGKNYLKVFFEDDRDLYINEEKRYLMTKIYNKNDYNIDIDEQIYGLPNDNLALNSKKPYMEHKTRKNVVPYLITPEEAATQRKFFDYLMNEANRGYTNIFLTVMKMRLFQRSRENLSQMISQDFLFRFRKEKNCLSSIRMQLLIISTIFISIFSTEM